jgi:hypothetical protein
MRSFAWRVGLHGLGLRMDQLKIIGTAKLQLNEGLEWIAGELGSGTSALPSAIVDSEEISLVKFSN